jgi:NAD(P)-dependent dehydrogenase (short-subunit alcohol dehydrogenase family)
VFENSLHGKCALVTGAFGGLGRHFALTLVRAGARVGLVGRRVQAGEALAAEIRAAGGEVVVHAMDVTDPQSVQAAVDAVAAALGPLDVLVNNAGVAVTRPFLEITEQDWNGVVEVNLNGAWRVAQCVARQMRDSKRGGSIVNIASITGVRVAGAIAAYVASKAGLIQLTQAMALELARYDIRVNALAPGYIETDNTAALRADEPRNRQILERIPAGRWGDPTDIAGAAVFLASPAADYVNGHVLAVDGGWLGR